MQLLKAMQMKTIVGLKKIRMRSIHGFHDFEKIIENDFEVSIECHFDDNGMDFLDYSLLYNKLETVFGATTRIEYIEIINKKIIESLINDFAFLNKIKIKTTKLFPPLHKFEGKGSMVITLWKK